ncbi:DUF1127 domain-containing protein [Consotaella aegiceratis]|uniref:DUF1127 domain-containing protein n=1 Tax=Consotaella aegiceratis TaxID=3097961 RepID=UPI002F41C629
MSYQDIRRVTIPSRTGPAGVFSLLARLARAGRRSFWQRSVLRRSRRHLLDLTDEQLRDVGITRRQALDEGRRSFYLD